MVDTHTPDKAPAALIGAFNRIFEKYPDLGADAAFAGFVETAIMKCEDACLGRTLPAVAALQFRCAQFGAVSAAAKSVIAASRAEGPPARKLVDRFARHLEACEGVGEAVALVLPEPDFSLPPGPLADAKAQFEEYSASLAFMASRFLADALPEDADLYRLINDFALRFEPHDALARKLSAELMARSNPKNIN